MSNNHIFNDKEEEESDLVFENLIKSSSSSIKVNREKSFIVDSFNKTTEKSLQQTPRNNKNSDSIEMHLTNNNNNINTDFNNKSLNSQVTINNNNSNKENFNNSNEMNYSNNSNKPQYSIADQPNINKPIATQVTISNSNNLKNDSNSQVPQYSIAAQANNLNDFNKNKPIVAQRDINFNSNQQLNNNNNINFESNNKPIMHNNNDYNQQNHTNHNGSVRPQYSNSIQSSIEFNNKPIVTHQIINNNEQFDSTFTKRRQQSNDEMNPINNLKINLNEFDDKNYKNNNMVNPDYYEKVSLSPPSNQSSKATEDFLNEIRMSNQSFQTPLSSNRKKMFSNPGSAHKPPHTLPPLNASKKYMSINNNSIDTEINNNNYESIFNGIEVYSNTPGNLSHQNQSRTSINHSNLSIGYNNPNQINDQMYPENFSNTNNNNNLNQEFDALQSRRRLLHELSVYI